MSDPNVDDLETDELEGRLTELFGEFVRADVLSESSQPDVTLAVCNMSYRVSNSESNRQVRQTAVVLSAKDLDLPQFNLAPHSKGMLGKLAESMIGGMDLNFEDSPDFSKAYLLFGWNEDAVRTLFNTDLRNYFADHGNWSVRGQGSQLVIFRNNEICEDHDIDGFTQQALELLSLFRDAEAQLDEYPGIQRDTSPADMQSVAQNMGGFAGAMLQAALEKFAVTQAELNTFLAEPVPRKPPKGMKRQVVGDTFVLIPIGVIFLVAGVIVGGATVIQSESKTAFEVGLLFLIAFPLIGGLMAGITMWYRRKKLRVLRRGIITTGTVSKEERSSIKVNDQLRHVVTVEYEASGTTARTTCSVSGAAVEKARQRVDSGQPVTLLVDPQDSSHVVCTDFLITFDVSR